MTEETQTFSAEEVKAYGEEMVRQFNEQKSNTHTFFTKVIQDPSTIKTGNLSEDELGVPNVPVRSLKELELFSKDVYMDDGWAKYFKEMAEIQTSTSLSKDGFLLKLSVTSKKELADVTPSKKKNSGWFKKKQSTE